MGGDSPPPPQRGRCGPWLAKAGHSPAGRQRQRASRTPAEQGLTGHGRQRHREHHPDTVLGGLLGSRGSARGTLELQQSARTLRGLAASFLPPERLEISHRGSRTECRARAPGQRWGRQHRLMFILIHRQTDRQGNEHRRGQSVYVLRFPVLPCEGLRHSDTPVAMSTLRPQTLAFRFHSPTKATGAPERNG